MRFLISSDRYRYFYMALSYNGKVLDGFQSFDIEISDIMMLLNRYKFYEDLVGKYRRMLSLQDGLFLEYSYVNDEVQLYEYYNGQSRRMYNSTLIQAEAEIKVYISAICRFSAVSFPYHFFPNSGSTSAAKATPTVARQHTITMTKKPA